MLALSGLIFSVAFISFVNTKTRLEATTAFRTIVVIKTSQSGNMKVIDIDMHLTSTKQEIIFKIDKQTFFLIEF